MPNINLQPTLTGKRLTLRPIVRNDWDSLYACASDREIWTQHPASDRYQQEVFRAWFDTAIASESALVIIDRAADTIVGSSRYYGFDSAAGEIEIGWTFLARSHWGGSYNLELKTLMLNHAFEFARTVVFWVGETNHRSRGAMTKIGGVLRGGVHHRAIAGDAPHVIFEITREAWQS